MCGDLNHAQIRLNNLLEDKYSENFKIEVQYEVVLNFFHNILCK